MLRWLMAVVLFLIPAGTAAAHVKWFTEAEAERAPIEQVLDGPFFLTALLSALALGTLPFIVTTMENKTSLDQMDFGLSKLQPYSYWIIQYGTAVSILIQQFTDGLFAPELLNPDGIISYGGWLSVLLLLLPWRITARAGALVLLLLFGLTTMEYGWFHMLDYLFYLGIFYVLLLHRTRAMNWNFPVLYFTTGLSLCWVAAEKWVYPGMARDIVQNHDVPTFGFSAETFAMMTGFIEFLVGFLLIIGVLNRLLAVGLNLIFLSTTLLFGWLELIGHFPIHIILLTFIIEGRTFYKPPVSYEEKRWKNASFLTIQFILALALIFLLYYRFA
ncbi:DoxX family membrane protein [Alkalicoccus chagannorensis]|uniref:DoxX family membrane protein n=1 Tax=Alkalicoccus chagannorensis TaxID=427072 RepID=UPI0003FD9C1B|nr:DoxX family membrane protein [Alkalicoccus chagannorensis]